MSILITICGRGGSKGVPGKNIKNLSGKPLIAYTIAHAQAFAKKYSADIALSTDSEEIKQVAANFGLITPYQRPAALATDKAGKIGVIEDVWKFMEKHHAKKYDFVMDLDVTAPLRNLQDLEEAWQQLTSVEEALNIFSVSPANRNPYFNMVEKKEGEFVNVIKSLGDIKSRHEAPKVYDMNASFYIFRRSYFESDWQISTTDRSLAYVMPHLCFDIDEPIDFEIMNFLISNNKLDFEF